MREGDASVTVYSAVSVTVYVKVRIDKSAAGLHGLHGREEKTDCVGDS